MKRVPKWSRIGRFSLRTSVAGLLVLALVLVPDGVFWRGPAAAALVGLALIGGVVAGWRSIVSPARASRTEA